MTNFIIQNLWLVLAFVAVLSLTAGMMLMGSKFVRRCQDCKLLRGCADREQKRMEAEPSITTAWRERGKP